MDTSAAAPDEPRRVIVGPFNRVEGDLEVRLQIEAGAVASAQVNATMFRGFESMLVGRDPLDALTIVPRICGICSVSQSMAAARALAAAWGVEPTANGLRAHNLMLACENLADHLTHFYLFFMPDFTRACYAGRAWHPEASRRFAALGSATPGEHGIAATAARVRWFELMGTLGGKWPHTGSLVPGGSTRALDVSERRRLATKLFEMRQFLERSLFGAPLEAVAALDGSAALQAWGQGDARAARSDLRLWLDIASDLGLAELGPGPEQLMSYGSYLDQGGQYAFTPGLRHADGRVAPTQWLADITEDACFTWLDSSAGAVHPFQGATVPDVDKPGAYTWNKAPRLHGATVEVGAHARQWIDGHPLVRALAAERGVEGRANVFTRVVARLLEISRIVPLMERWVAELEDGAPYAAPMRPVVEGQGVGLAEAARGALGHWLRISHGKISSYQIIAPTSWNFSPRDSRQLAGPLELALVGTPVLADGGDDAYVSVQHVVRSFDPCMVCTVH